MSAPTWSSLRRFGKSRVFQSSYFWLFFVPLAAKALSALELSLALPFSWRLFFLSSLLVSIANVLFLLRAPAVVQRFATYADYVEEGRGHQEISRWFERLLNSHWKAMGNSATGNVRQYLTTLGDSTTVPSTQLQAILAIQRAEVSEGKAAEAFWQVYTLADDLHGRSRAACWMAYLGGILLFLAVFAQNVWFVLEPWLTEVWQHVG